MFPVWANRHAEHKREKMSENKLTEKKCFQVKELNFLPHTDEKTLFFVIIW